jgi:hypothetical protein
LQLCRLLCDLLHHKLQHYCQSRYCCCLLPQLQ